MAERRGAEDQVPTYLVIGNGIAGVTATEILRAEDSAAHIVVIADDPFPVYYRPALKDYLGGRVREDKLWARSENFYQEQNILFHADRLVGIQVGPHIAQLQSGRQVNYDRLLLAHGARPARLRCPGSNLQGVCTLRTVADYQAVLEALNTVRRIVVSGSGTLALETIETLRHRGYEITHLVRRRTLWSDVLDPTASDIVLQQEQRDKVDVRLEEEIAEITGDRGKVSGVVTTRGDTISCEMVIVAIGIEPIIDFVKGSGIACGRGIKVDNTMHTNAPDVYAAGDVLETTDTMTGRARVIGQWYPAIQQARAAAYSMLGLLDVQRPFQFNTCYNATFLYGLDFASVGLTNVSSGFQEIVADPQPRSYRKVLLKDGVPVGMLSLGNRKQALAFKRAIDHRVNLLPVASRLFDNDFKLNSWLDSQGIPPPVLSVNREGVAAIKKAAYSTTDSAPVAVPELKPSLPVEAFLAPVIDPSLEIRLAETLLSQTKMMTVGRQPGVFLLIDEGTISRRHAEISYANGQYILHDLGSTNGTFINNVRLEPSSTYALKENDQVRFGTTVKFTFLQRRLPEQITPPAPVKVAAPTDSTVAIKRTTTNRQPPPVGQPVLNADASLSLPGVTGAIPVDNVATFKEGPALVILVESSSNGGKKSPKIFPLKKDKRVMLGRGKGNDIELLDVVVSRRHAEVFPGPDDLYIIRDLGSSNGVTVNQVKIEKPCILSHGDRIMLGSSHMIYFVDLHAGQEAGMRNVQKPAQFLEESTSTRQPVAQGAGAQQGIQPQVSASLPQMTMCRKCGVANTRVARFCASCSALLRP